MFSMLSRSFLFERGAEASLRSASAFLVGTIWLLRDRVLDTH